MPRFPCFVLALLATVAPTLAAPGEINLATLPKPAAGAELALVGARLIDGRGGAPLEDAAVLIRGERIVAVGRRADVRVPAGAEVVDLAGLTLLPGLVDAHLHTKDPAKTARMFLLNGVTSARDPGHPFAYYANVAEAKEPLPRIFLTGSHLDAAPPAWPDQARLIATADEARRAVHEHVDRGASAIKIYFRLPVPFIAAASEAARERGVPVTAHLELIDPRDAIRAGVRGIEHITSFGIALASEAEARRFRAAVDANHRARTQERFNLWATLDLEDETRTKPLLELLVRERVFVSPTLGIFHYEPGHRDFSEVKQRAFQNMLRFVGQCHRAGVTLVVGSHTSAPHAKTGWAFQHEMELLTRAGLSPLAAIRAGTLDCARFLRADDRVGTIEPGKLADLLLVAGNPAADIRAMHDVRGVMLNGVWVRRPGS